MTKDLRIKDLNIGDKFKTRSGRELYEIISDTISTDSILDRICKVYLNNDIFEKEIYSYIKVSKI